MTGEDAAPGAVARIALGETGFERSAVWSAVGLALSYVVFDAAGAVGVAPVVVAGVVAAVTALGATSFAATGGGVLPTALLSYGPAAGALLRLTGPEPYAVPLSVDGPTVLAVAEPLGGAVALALATGVVAAAIGSITERAVGRTTA